MLWKSKRLWGLLVAILLLAYCVKDIRGDDLIALSERLNLWYLGASILGSYLFVSLRAIRWHDMAFPGSVIGFGRSILLFAAGQFLNVAMPALTGQVGRVLLFARQTGLRKSLLVSTVVLELVFDALSVVCFLLLISMVFVFPDEYRALSVFVFGGTLFVLAVLYVVIFSRRPLENLIRKMFRTRWPGAYVAIMRFLRSFAKGLRLLRSSHRMLWSLSLSLAAWSAHAGSIYFLFRAFGIDLPFPAAAAIMIIASIALMIPITPGNAGTFEVAVSTALMALKVGKAEAVLFAFALHIVDLLPALTLGFFSLSTLRDKKALSTAVSSAPAEPSSVKPRPRQPVTRERGSR